VGEAPVVSVIAKAIVLTDAMVRNQWFERAGRSRWRFVSSDVVGDSDARSPTFGKAL
jgi:hypothetical protein